MKRQLTSRLTRLSLDPFIASQASGAYTLDIGCGDSRYAKYFTRRVGLDTQKGPGVDVVGNIYALPFPDSTFEQILCTEVLEHLTEPERAVSEMKRVLKKGGKLVLTTRFLYPIHDAPHDYLRYTKYALCHLFREWEIIVLRKETTTFDTFALLLQTLYRTRMRGGMFVRGIILLAAKAAHSINVAYRYFFPPNLDVLGNDDIDFTSGYYLIARM